MIIDAHVHYTPPSLKARLHTLADSEPYWHLLLNPPTGKSIQAWSTAERMIHNMDATGIDKIVLVGEYFRQHENCVQRNNQAIDIINRWPDRVLALATIQPNAGSAALAELDRCIDNGLVGVGELNPYAQGFHLDDDNFLKLADRCIDHDIPINLHVSEEIGGYYLGKSTTPLRSYYELACQRPDLKLILAHWGGGLFLYEIMPRVRRQLHSVWYDTAATPLLYPVDKIFATALTCIDHRKLLHGSDYPLRIYPRTMKEANFRPFLAAMDQLPLDEKTRADIMGRNAARLFGLLKNSGKNPEGNGVDHRAALKPISPAEPSPASTILPMTSIGGLLDTWPETEEILGQFGIRTRDVAAPKWEPLQQIAAAKGMSRSELEKLIEALNTILLDAN